MSMDAVLNMDQTNANFNMCKMHFNKPIPHYPEDVSYQHRSDDRTRSGGQDESGEVWGIPAWWL